MSYELWDMISLNTINSYDSEATALAVVAAAVARHGESYVDGLALVYEDDGGNSSTVAQGSALMERVAQ